MRIKRNQRHFPLTLPLLRLNFAPESPTFSSWVLQAGERGLCSVDNALYLPLIPFHALSLFQGGVPPTWDTPGWSSVCCSLTAELQEQTAPAWAPCRVNRPCQNSFSCMGSSSWAAAPTRSLLLHGLSIGSSTVGYSIGCRGTACLTIIFITGCTRMLMPVTTAPPSLLLYLPWCLQSCFSPIFSFLSQMLQCRFFFFNLK